MFVGQDNQVACHDWYPGVIQNNSDGSCPVLANQDASEATCGPNRTKCTWANDLYGDLTMDYIRDHAADTKPFFIFFSTTTPHEGSLKGSGTSYPTPEPYMSRFPEFDDQPETRRFATAVSAQDDLVGAVLDALEAHSLTEDTIVIFSGDNGPDPPTLTYARPV